MKDNDLDDWIEKQSKKLTDRELLERNFVSLHYVQKKLNYLEKVAYWITPALTLIVVILLYEFPPLWSR